MPTPPGTPPPTPAQPAGRGQRPRRDRYGRPMSKWSVATGRIRRHATGILGGRIGGVGAAPNQLVPNGAGSDVAGSDVAGPGVTTSGVAAPGVTGPGVPAPDLRSEQPEASPTPPPTPAPRPAAPLSDDTVRMPRQPAATAVPAAARSIGTSDGAGVPSALTERTVNLRLPPALRRAAARRPGHRVGRFLRAIDRRLLPPVGRALAMLGRGALWGRVVVTTGAVACVALTVVAVYTATRPTTPDPKPAGIHVGPTAGEAIHEYTTTRKSILDQAAKADAPTSRYALVSFTSYVQPERLTLLLGGVQPAEVFLQASPAGVVEAPVRLIPDDVVKAIGAHARELQAAVDVLEAKIGLMTGQSSNEIALKASYGESARAEMVEMAAYTNACRCAFGAVVHGPVTALAALARRDGVLVVDLVPLTPDVSQDTFMPAVPGQTTATPPPVEESQTR